MSKITIATRKSPLALWQARHVTALLKEYHPENEYELLEIVTEGDKTLDTSLAKIGGKGLFVKDIERAILDGLADFAVHSAKDMPAALHSGLCIGAILKREDPFDALISKDSKRLVDLPKNAVVGTSSARRRAQLMRLRQDLHIIELRGNVNTRLEKLDSGEFDAIILAAASVKRMGWESRIAQILDNRFMIPACGQGALAIESRRGDKKIRELIECINDKKTYSEVEAERSFLARIGGGCQMPAAVYCQKLSEDRYDIEAAIFSPDGAEVAKSSKVGFKNVIVAFELANEILENGGQRILNSIIHGTGTPGAGQK